MNQIKVFNTLKVKPVITSSKAQTLFNLQSLVEQFEVPHIFLFKATDRIDNKKSVFNNIKNSF